MAELTRCSALQNHPGAVPGIREVRYRTLVQINGAPNNLHTHLAPWAFEKTPQALKAVAGKDAGLLWNGPNQFLLVSENRLPEAVCGILAEQLKASDATWVDLSHARTVFELSGPHARDILAKGCPLDVDSLHPGASTPTVLAHFNILLHCQAPQSFQIFVFRSFGYDCMTWLAHAAHEFQMGSSLYL